VPARWFLSRCEIERGRRTRENRSWTAGRQMGSTAAAGVGA
jgi:hypothetical protein